MGRKLPVLRPREVIAALKRAGFHVAHQTGSHARLLHSSNPRIRVTVAVHPGDIPPQILRAILRQAEMTEEEFLAALK